MTTRPLQLHPDRLFPVDPDVRSITRRLYESVRDLPIISLTAKATAQDQAQCIAAGANDYLAKPLDVDKLLSLVRVWMPR